MTQNTYTLDKMTAEQFKKCRESLGLSVRDLAHLLNTSEKTVRKFERDSGFGPNPIAVRVLCWLRDGFRPPEYPVEDAEQGE